MMKNNEAPRKPPMKKAEMLDALRRREKTRKRCAKIVFRLDEPLARELNAMAARKGRTVQEVLADAVRTYLLDPKEGGNA